MHLARTKIVLTHTGPFTSQQTKLTDNDSTTHRILAYVALTPHTYNKTYRHIRICVAVCSCRIAVKYINNTSIFKTIIQRKSWKMDKICNNHRPAKGKDAPNIRYKNTKKHTHNSILSSKSGKSLNPVLFAKKKVPEPRVISRTAILQFRLFALLVPMEFSQQKVLRNCFRVNGWMCSSASYVLQYAGTPYNKCAIWLPSDEYSYRCRTAFHNVRVHTRRLAASKIIHLSSSSHFCSLGQFRLLIVAKNGKQSV